MVHGSVHIQRCCYLLLSGLLINVAFVSPAVANLPLELERIQPLVASGRYFTALEALSELETDYPDSSRLKLEQALVYIQLEQFDSALSLLTLVMDNPDLPDAVRVQVQLLYLSTRRKQNSTHPVRWRGRARVSYFTGLDTGMASAQLSHSRSSRVATLDAQGYPWYLNRVFSVRSDLYLDSTDTTPEWGLDLAGGLQQNFRNLTLDSQVGVVLKPSEPEPYAQLGLAYQVSRAVQLGYRLKGHWIATDFEKWQHRFSTFWSGEYGWQANIAFGLEDRVNSDDYYRFWQTSVTRLDPLPITLRLAQTDSTSTDTTEANLSADFNIAPRWSVVPELGYWHTNTWQGWRLALGVEWTP